MFEMEDINVFQDHYMPPQSSELVLNHAVHIFHNTRRQTAEATYLAERMTPDGEYDELYLQRDFNELIQTLGKENILHAKYQLSLRPTELHVTSRPGGTYKVEGCFILRSANMDRLSLTSVALCIECKKGMEENNVSDSETLTRLMKDTSFLMDNDPRRRFTFGVSIEESKCTVWYFSRSHLAKSASFDWKTNIRLFLSVMLSFATATPEQLGFDPKIAYIESPKESFIYEVSDGSADEKRYFHTQELISELRSICITCRATRVWKVVEVSGPASTIPEYPRTEMVLKDVWINESAKTDKAIQVEIFKDADSFKDRIRDLSYIPPEFENLDPPLRTQMRTLFTDDEKYKEYFLTIVCDSGLLGATSKSVPKDRCIQEAKHDLIDDAASSNTRLPCHPHAYSTQSPKPERDREYVSKRRYFVVFKEVCKAGHELETLDETAEALKGGLIALFILFAAGWVHRDISSGNILLYEPSKGQPRGILMDLEYAKRFPSTGGSADPKTGTAFFMATEIIYRISYCHLVNTNDNSAADFKLNLDDSEATQPNSVTQSESKVPRHSPVHDIESLWWLFLWVLVARLPYVDWDYRMQQVFINEIVKISTDRQEIFSMQDTLLDELNANIHAHVKPLAQLMDDMRSRMLGKYKKLAVPTMESGDSAQALYKSEISVLYKFFHQLLVLTTVLVKHRGDKIPALLPLRGSEPTQPENSKSKKRARVDDGEDEGMPVARNSGDQAASSGVNPPPKLR